MKKDKQKSLPILANLFRSGVLISKISNKYRICLIRIGRRKDSFFKIVVTNSNRRKIDIIGSLTPNRKKQKLVSNLSKKDSTLPGKQLDINFEKLFFWVEKHAVPSIFVYHLLKSLEQSFLLLTLRPEVESSNAEFRYKPRKESIMKEYSNE